MNAQDRKTGGVRKLISDKMHNSDKSNLQQQTDFRIEQRNLLSHAEFPDVKSATSINKRHQIGKQCDKNAQMKQYSTHKVAKFKPFDPNIAPANFQKRNKNVNSQNGQYYNSVMTNGQQCYSAQGQTIYQYIPPPEFSQTPQPPVSFYAPNMNMHMMPTGSSATAVAPNGEKIFIPLDDKRYEIKRGNHDLYDMPQECDLYPLSSEGNFESSVQLHSPRPVDVRGSLSDEWSGSSQDRPYSETESEHETTEQDTETDASEIANNFVVDVLKTITETVENLAFQCNEDPNIAETTRNTIESAPCEQIDTTDIEMVKDLSEKSFEVKNANFDGYDIIVQPIKQNKTDTKNISSSSSEADDPSTTKRAKVDSEIKDLEENNKKPDVFKGNKKSKSKKARAWKENRKDKPEKTGTRDKQEIKVDSAREKNEAKQNISYSVHGCVAKSPATESQENVIIDGQGYFKTHQLQNGQYQPYYTADTYTFVPDQYQQGNYSTAPEYTMFVHDACPPPAQDEVFGQVHKSLSGELINHHASAYQSQTLDGAKIQQLERNNLQTSFDNASEISNEQIHGNTEGVLPPVAHYECYGAANGLSPYAWTSCETQPVYNQFNSCTVTDQPEQQSEGQGQIYISYDEDSVYIDPESGLSYPALHTTDDNLITVILRDGVFLEITANKVLRLVNHEKKLVVAINETGDKASVIHPAARIYQSDSNVHTELYLGRRAKMTDELVMFGNKLKTYKFDSRMVTEMTEQPAFRDLSHDESVSFLSTDGAVGNEEMKLKIEEILAHAHFWKNGTCGSTVIINGTKVVQNEKGDVSVYSGPIKFIRMNPDKMVLRLKTQFIEVDIETNWNVKISRGAHALNASHMGFIVCNGKIKACLDTNNKLQSFSMPDHRFLMLGQPISQHRPGVPGGQSRRASNRNTEPEGDHWGYIRQCGDDDHSRFRDWEDGWDCEFDNRNCHKRWDPQAGRWIYPSRQWHWR